jgi:hypothetical protein
MRNKLIIVQRFLLVSVVLFFSCKKDHYKVPSLATLTVVNAIVGGSNIKVGSLVNEVSNNFYSSIGIRSGNLDLYVWPIGDSLHPYYTYSKFYAEDHGVYSLFLTGQSPNATGVLLYEKFPYHLDSTCGIRFINLSPNSPPINITLSTTPTVNEVSNLAYLQNTEFKLYSAKSSYASYSFQIRKASDNSLLMTVPLTTPRFANVTIVVRGLVGSKLGFTRVNNDR